MDEFLPSEFLAKIASNLSYKDVNSLLRTSKTAHAKLTPYRHILPKIKCWITVKCQTDKICLNVAFGAWKKSAHFYDRRAGADELTEEENRDRVVQFYKGGLNVLSPTVKESIFLGRLEGLSLHMQTMLSFALIFYIDLYHVDDNLVLEELARVIRQSRSIIGTISIHPKEFRSSNFEFITACKPIKLTVSGNVQLPDNFYNLPVIQRLTQLTVFSDEKTVHNLSKLSASGISIRDRANITIDHIEQIISQWAESKRTIRFIVFDFNNSLIKQKCIEWICHLDNSLFEVKPDIHERMTWVLTRRCDCTKIKFECFRKFLVINSAV